MGLDEVTISKAIIEDFNKDLLNFLEVDVAIGGAGPAGLTAAFYLAKNGVKTVIFERSLRTGGGMPGGGMMFNKIVVQKAATEILKEMGINYSKYKENYYVADSIEATSALTYKAVQAGVKIFNLMEVEDIMIQREKLCGFVINWTAVRLSNLHVDPLTIRCKAGIDATGHDCGIVKNLEKRSKIKLNTSTGKIVGEGAMWAEEGEKTILENTKEVYPGLYVVGMAANAVYGTPRMGPIFGGMLLSGRKAAQIIIRGVRSSFFT
ncbi:thiazole biosynthesis protein [Candidatus Aerophobetes bacterium]|nr:thiazole biosynthesis protein [Candidatus Aerophobetes bacterium]